MYPTLARMALDILPIPASSTSCERLFSRAKLASTDRRSRLGVEIFEAIECLNFHWKKSIVDFAKVNSQTPLELTEDDLAGFDVLEEEAELLVEEPEVWYIPPGQ